MSAIKSRTYAVQHNANESKLNEIRKMLPLWQSCLVTIQLIQIRKLKQGQRLGWLTASDLEGWNLPLSARQLKSVTNQVNAALRSWQELTKINVRAMIRDGGYSDAERHELNRINVSAAWWTDPRTAKMVDASLKVTPFPNMGRSRTMLMDSTVCRVEESTGTSFDTWLKVSTLSKGHPVRVPIRHSDYFTSRDGVEAGVTQVRVSDNGDVMFSRVKQSPSAAPRAEGTTIGVDWGLVSLFTTSDGRRLGTQLYGWLKERDIELVKLTADLQRRGIKPNDSKRFRRMNARIREYVKNEVNRILNIIADDTVREIVTEKLDFRHGGLSRRMNRILSRAGRGAVKAKLASLEETHGIVVTEVNASHTSRECDGCGFTDKSNRRSQDRFRCLFCGKKLHADIKGARTILNRRSAQGSGYRWLNRHEVLATLDTEFERRWRISAAEVRERHKRGRSTATSASLVT